MKKELTAVRDMQPFEVSLVKRGANKKRPFPMFKSEEYMDIEEILKAVLETETDGESELEELLKAGVSEKGVAAAKSALRILQAFKDELPKDVLDKLGAIAGMENQKDDKKPDYKYPEPMKKVEQLEGLPEEIKKQVELVLKSRDDEIDAVRKQNDSITKALQAERDARDLAVWVEKARSELSHFPGKSADEMGKILKSLHDVDPELAKSQFEQMQSASELIKKSQLLTNTNTVAIGGSSSSSAWDQIEKLADGLVQKSDTLMSKSKAIAQVMEVRPDLYSQYLRDNPSQTQARV